MKTILSVYFLVSFFLPKYEQEKILILVLPSFDQISNAGVSPNVRGFIENCLETNNFKIIPFPFKKLMNIPYQNVFDKKYCKPILDKVKSDIIVMSKIDRVSVSGNLDKDKWNLRIRILNTKTDRQINSSVKCDSLTEIEMKSFIEKSKETLISEIRNIR